MKLWINEFPAHWIIFLVMFIANILVVILIYALILCTVNIDKDVLYHEYIFNCFVWK